MSNTSDTKPYIKISDSFDVPIQMIDTSTGEAVEITSGMMFSSKIINLQGEVIATPSVVPTVGVTIRVAGGGSLALTQQYSRVLLEYVSSNEWVMYR